MHIWLCNYKQTDASYNLRDHTHTKFLIARKYCKNFIGILYAIFRNPHLECSYKHFLLEQPADSPVRLFEGLVKCDLNGDLCPS